MYGTNHLIPYSVQWEQYRSGTATARPLIFRMENQRFRLPENEVRRLRNAHTAKAALPANPLNQRRIIP